MSELPDDNSGYYAYDLEMYDNKLCAVCGMVIGIPIEPYAIRFHVAPEALQWCNYFRAIHSYPEKSQPRTHKITGVGFCDFQLREDELPFNPNVTFHDGRNNSRHKTIYSDCECKLGSSQCDSHRNWHGLYIHSLCWDVVERVVGPLPPRQLDIFIEAMRQMWKTSYPYQPYALNEVIDAACPEVDGMFRWIGGSLDLCLSQFSDITAAEERNSSLCQFSYISETEDSETDDWFLPLTTVSIPLTDPFHVPELQGLIERCKNHSSPCEKSVAARSAKRSRQERKALLLKRRTCPQNIPLDIGLMIFDELCISPLDAVNAVDAFHWRFPEEIWRKKLPLDILVELDDISNNDFDWRRFFIEFSRLMETEASQGMASRKRIFTVVNAIRDEFLGRISEQVSRIDESIRV